MMSVTNKMPWPVAILETIALLACFGPVLLFSAPAYAQQASQVVQPLCMISPAPPNATGQGFVVIIPSGQQQSLAERGFTNHTCSDDPNSLQNYRVKICELAEKAPAGVLDQFSDMYRVSPRELCDMANEVAKVQ